MPNTSSGGGNVYGVSSGSKGLDLENATKRDAGTYVCKMFDSIPGKVVLERSVDIIVLGEFEIFHYNLLK